MRKSIWYRRSIISSSGVAAAVLLAVLTVPLTGQQHARAGEITVQLEGRPVQFEAEPFIEDGRVMVPMRDIFERFDGRMYWDGVNRIVRVFAGGQVLTLQVGSTEFDHNGTVVKMETAPLIRDGRTYVPVRFIAQSLGLNVDWNAETRSVEIGPMANALAVETPEPPPAAPLSAPAPAQPAAAGGGSEPAPSPPATEYSEEEIDLLTRVINAEAYGEPFEGKVAVGAVILNRVKDPAFPDSITEVIRQPNQFYVVRNGQINRALEPDSRDAALKALSGADPTGGALFFWDPEKSRNTFVQTLSILTQIGTHAFAK